MQPSRFTNRDDAGQERVYRSWRGKCAARTVGAGTQGVAQTVWRQFFEPTDGLGVAVFGGKKTLLRQSGVLGAQAGGQDIGIEAAVVTKVGGIGGKPTHTLGVSGLAGPLDRYGI